MTDLNKQQFEQKLKDPNAVVINVLDIELYNNEHIPGSQNAPAQAIDFMEQVNDLADKEAPIVVYSGGKDCPAAPQAARKLEEEGYSNVATYTGGMEEWKENGGKLESNIPGAVDEEEEDGASISCGGGACGH